MRNPPRTQQISIFEPLFSPEEALRTPRPTHLIHSSSSEWLSSTYSAPSPSVDNAHCNNQLRTAPTTIFNEEMSTNQRKCADHELLSDMGRSMQSAPAPSRSLSSGNIDRDDDGSVASKLLTSITKSLSSPSLLSCCKESVRETPYQKTLKLRMMKLQHCAEELGSESSDGALIYSNGGVNSTFDSLSTMSSFESSSRLSTPSYFASPLPYSSILQNDQIRGQCNASPMMISVRSAPNLGCPSLVSRHTSHIRERSFPPPLTHTLTRSASADSSTTSLRAHREDGRFVLKEVKVPSRKYLQANRKGGRLTLQLFTSADEDIKQEDYVHKELEDAMDVQQDESVARLCEEGLRAASDKGDIVGCSDSGEVALESANIVDVEADAAAEGDAKVIERKEGKEISDDVNMVEIEENMSKEAKSDVRKDGGLSAKSLVIAAMDVEDDGKAYEVSHFGMKRPDFDGSECERENWLLASLQGARFNINRSLPSSTIIFKDVGASSLIENVTKVVNSFGLDGGKWCQRKVKSRDQLERSGFKSGQLKDSSNGMTSIRKVHKKGPAHKVIAGRKVDTHKAMLDIAQSESEIEPACTDTSARKDGGGGIINMDVRSLSATTKPTTLHFDVLLPPLHLDWLHSLQCKELSQRGGHFANKGFPYVAIRS